MYNVYQHWDPLKVCVVGKSYPPELYSFIKNSRVRSVMERIAIETEEDYQSLINLLESFGVKVLRPKIHDDLSKYLSGGRYIVPPMTPRDYSATIGTDFYFGQGVPQQFKWNQIRGASWPEQAPATYQEALNLPKDVLANLASFGYILDEYTWSDVLDDVAAQGNKIILNEGYNTACMTRVGKDLYHGTGYEYDNLASFEEDLQKYKLKFPNYRNSIVNTGGHSDASYCPVVPGLIVSLSHIPTYKESFPGWEVIYLPNQSWDMVKPFLDLKQKNKGKWWVPGAELNDDFTDFVESWLGHWVGYVEETVFDVNMLVIDEKNVVCNNYNKQVFDAFERRGITPHVVNFRHRYFWDGGLHCVTADVHREGSIKDYFPERGLDGYLPYLGRQNPRVLGQAMDRKLKGISGPIG